MMAQESVPRGPGTPFRVLFDEAVDAGPSLPEAFQRIYGSDWRLPTPQTRPYVYVNFAVSRDGRVSFNEPGHLGGGDVSGFNPHDQWLMGLLRARADAVLVGDNTLRIEHEHVWTAEYICPADAISFAALRHAEGHQPFPLQVFLSLHGDLPPQAAVFNRPEMYVVVATTTAGRDRAHPLRARAARVDVLDLGVHSVAIPKLLQILRNDYGVKILLCEGGPRVYGSLLQARQVDDEFLTLCPIIIGNPPDRSMRPGLVEGVAFAPGAAPLSRLISLRRAGDHLFLRSRFEFMGTSP